MIALRGVAMASYLKLNTVLESVLEYFVLQHLRQENLFLADFLLDEQKIIIHSVELIDDELMVANIEHTIWDPLKGDYMQPKFAKVEITPIWPVETVFNIELET